MADSNCEAWLERRSGERIILQDLCLIGRDPNSGVVIPAHGVSRKHAVIRRTTDGTYQLMDMGSSNGTFLNGTRLSRPAVLTNGSVVDIGGDSFVFRLAGAHGPASGIEEPAAPCWLVSIEAVHARHREALGMMGDKTSENWSERCHRLLTRLRAKALRPGSDALLLYWPGDTSALSILGALRTLLTVQQPSEEIHVALHHSVMRFRRSSAGDVVPVGLGAIHVLQMQRLIRLVSHQVLISRAAMDALGLCPGVKELSGEALAQLPKGTEVFTLG